MSSAPIDFSSIGGKPVGGGKAIDFSSIGGKPVDQEGQQDFAANPPGVPRPNFEQLPAADAMGELDPNSFMYKVGQRIKDVGYAIPNALDTALKGQATPEEIASAKHLTGADQPTTTGKIIGAATIGPRMVYEQAKEYVQNPAALAGDVILAAPALSEIKLPSNRQPAALPKPPVSDLTPEQQAKYTTALDKANVDYAQQAADEQAARAKWVEKSFASKQSAQAAEAAANRQEALARGQEALASRLAENIQQTHDAVRTVLNNRWDDLRMKVGEQPLDTGAILKGVEKSREMLAGVPEDLRIFNDIANSIDQRALEAANVERMNQAGTEPPVQAVSPLNFSEGRIQYSALGEKWANADGNLRRAIGNLYNTYGDVLQKAADAGGAGKEYSALRRDWHNYANDWLNQQAIQRGGSPLAKARQIVDPQFLQQVVTGKAGDRLLQTLGKYSEAGGNPQLAQQLRQMASESKALKIPKRISPPPPYQAQTPELRPVQRPQPEVVPPKPGFLLKHGARLGGKIVGGTLGTLIKHPLAGYAAGSEMGNELANRIAARHHVPPPPPAMPPENILPNASAESAASQEAINRLASQRAAGIKTIRIDTRSGREIPIYGVDAVDAKAGPYDTIVQRGPDGDVIIDQGNKARPMGRQPIPRTNEEYLRTILAAKEGEISPGEANRRISRGGGNVRVKPLSRPPE